MPSRTSNKNLRGLPSNPSPEGVRCISVRVPDDPEWIGAFYGQLQRLSLQSIWDRDEEHTAETVAAVWKQVYLDTLAGNCTSGICTIPPPFDIDIGIELPIIRLGADGHFEEFRDGEWGPLTGDFEVPPLDARTEPTASERKCLAAANAAEILELTYEEATDAFITHGTDVAVYEAILGFLGGALGVAFGLTFAPAVGMGFGAFLVFNEILETVLADQWTVGFTEELVCVLYANATDTAGVVTFNWEGVLSDLYQLSFEAGLDLDRQLLLQQVLFMLSMIAVDGLNQAGTTTTVSSYDCTFCSNWCRYWDFAVSNGGFTVISGACGFYDTSLTPDRWRAAQNCGGVTVGIRIHKTWSDTEIAAIEVDYDLLNAIGVGNPGNLGIVRLFLNGSVVWTSPGTIGNCANLARAVVRWEIPDILADELILGTEVHRNTVNDGCSAGTATGAVNIYSVRLEGTGVDPFSDGVTC